MAIQDHYNSTVSVQRLTTVTGNKKSYQAHIASLACEIQPLDPSITQDIAGGFGKDKLMFCDNADIIEGDRVIHGSNTYRVVGIENYDSFLKKSRQMEIVLRIFKS